MSHLQRSGRGPSVAAVGLSALVVGVAVGLAAGYFVWGVAPQPGEDAGIAPVAPIDEQPMDTATAPLGEGLDGPVAEPIPEEPLPLDHLEEEVEIWPARHLFVSIPGTSLDAATRAHLRELKPGGVLLQADNLRDADQTKKLVEEIKAAVGLGEGISDLPLIAVEQEGGPFNRLGLDDAPSARELGQHLDVQRAYEVGLSYAEACIARGIGVVFAPVLDVYEPGGHTRLEPRSFGTDNRVVAAIGLSFADGLVAGGVVAAAKHFPGHGGTQEDSHDTLAILTKNKAGLGQVMYPFSEAVRVGVPGLIAGHIAVPSFDTEAPTRPASLSPVWLREVLRERWGYGGVILADDLTMKAITESAPVPEAAVAALAAGGDALIILERDPALIQSVCEAIAAAVESGALDREQITASMRRLDKWQARLRTPEPLVQPLPELAQRPADPDAEADGVDAPLQEAAMTEGFSAPETSAAEAKATPETEAAVEAVEAPVAGDGREIVHVVKEGEFLSRIATAYGVTQRQIEEWNDLTDTRILVGQRLRIVTDRPEETTEATAEEDAAEASGEADGSEPEAADAAEAPSADAAAAEPAPVAKAPAPTPPVETDSYTVESGDTVFGLSRRFGLTPARLLEMNGMTSDSVLKAGQRLRVPKGAASAE